MSSIQYGHCSYVTSLMELLQYSRCLCKSPMLLTLW